MSGLLVAAVFAGLLGALSGWVLLHTHGLTLLMDEPCEGLAPVIVEALVDVLAELRQSEGLSIVLVEHNTRVALDFAERVVVMDRGRIVYDGASEVLRRDAAQLERLIGVAQA